MKEEPRGELSPREREEREVRAERFRFCGFVFLNFFFLGKGG